MYQIFSVGTPDMTPRTGHPTVTSHLQNVYINNKALFNIIIFFLSKKLKLCERVYRAFVVEERYGAKHI